MTEHIFPLQASAKHNTRIMHARGEQASMCASPHAAPVQRHMEANLHIVMEI